MTIELIGGGSGGGAAAMPTYTWASKPASAPVGAVAFISDAGANGSHWFYDGTNWDPVGGNAELASLDVSSAAIGNVETFALQYLIPANLWQVGGVLRTNVSFVKSGAVDVGQITVRIGAAGTVADAALFGPSQILGAANRQTSLVFDVRLESSTSAQLMPNTVALGYSVNNGTVAAPVAIPTSTAPLFFSLGGVSAGTTDTVTFMQAQVFLLARVN